MAKKVVAHNSITRNNKYLTVVVNDTIIVNIDNYGETFLVFDASTTDGFDPNFKFFEEMITPEIKSKKESCSLFFVVPGNSQTSPTKAYFILVSKYTGRALSIPCDYIQGGIPTVNITKSGVLSIEGFIKRINLDRDFQYAPKFVPPAFTPPKSPPQPVVNMMFGSIRGVREKCRL